jgi:hypothetical protein
MILKHRFNSFRDKANLYLSELACARIIYCQSMLIAVLFMCKTATCATILVLSLSLDYLLSVHANCCIIYVQNSTQLTTFCNEYIY